MERVSEAQQFLSEDVLPTVLTSSLMAFPIQGNAVLLQINSIAQCHKVTLESPFVSVGSGDFQADPFLAFVKQVVWHERHPDSLDDGIFGVLWTLQHVIKVNEGLGVGGSPVIATL